MTTVHIRSFLTVLLLAAPLKAAVAQTHVYNLQGGSLSDANGGPSLVSDGGTLGPNGYSFGPQQGLSLSNVFSPGNSYSIVFRAAINSLSSSSDGYVKFVDFQNLQSDHGYYAYFGAAAFDPYNFKVGSNEYVANVMAVTTITLDASSHWVTIYVNGVEKLSFQDGARYAEFSGPNGIAHFFEDDLNQVNPATGVVGPFENASGIVDYLATYNSVLTADEVAHLTLPPSTFATPEPGSIALLATGLIGVCGVMRRRKDIARRLTVA